MDSSTLLKNKTMETKTNKNTKSIKAEIRIVYNTCILMNYEVFNNKL